MGMQKSNYNAFEDEQPGVPVTSYCRHQDLYESFYVTGHGSFHMRATKDPQSTSFESLLLIALQEDDDEGD